jgi:hypothetical protein
MKRVISIDLLLLSTALVAAGCGDDPPSTGYGALGSADAGGLDTPAPTPSSPATPATPSVSGPGTTTGSTPPAMGTPSVSTLPPAASTSAGAPTNTGGAGGTPAVPSSPVSASGGAGGSPAIPACEVVVNFDAAWGVVATGGGTSPMEWETSVTPTVSDGVFSVEVPFTSSAQQFGWNGDYPSGPVDCTGRELVARVRLLSGFVEDPQSAPGGVQMYLFSNDWGNSITAWNNVPAPSEDWFEVSVGCAASADSAFDPALVNGIGFTFNSGGADASVYAATAAAFSVDHLCWRTSDEPMGAGGAGGMGGQGNGGAGGSGGVDPIVDAGESTAALDAGSEPSTDASGEPPPSDGGGPADAGGESTSSADAALDSGSSSGSDAGSTVPDDCEMLIDFQSPWGVVATGGGTAPEEWETLVEPTVAGGVFSVLVPFESAVQQFGWVGDHPNGSVDCTGWELVARVRLTSGFVENPETMGGGVQVYLFSDAWGVAVNAWNVVPAPSDEWFEASVTCATAQSSEFDPSDVNGIGFTFNSGGEAPADYSAEPAEFEVDYLCWRK